MHRWTALFRASCSSCHRPLSTEKTFFVNGARRLSSYVQQTQRKREGKEPQVLAHDPSSNTSSPSSQSPTDATDPYKIIAPELNRLRKTLLGLLGSAHPALTSIAEYYFRHPSKQLRPLLVLLFARATNGLGAAWPHVSQYGTSGGISDEELDAPLSRPDVLNDYNPCMPDHTTSFDGVFSLIPPSPPRIRPESLLLESTYTPTLASPARQLPTQMRLAQIVEMIHVASLLHDDVIDHSSLRRGAPSAPAAFGNKLSILAGDFLLGRASAALSRLGSSEVVELIASVINNLVEGEILQMKEIHGASLGLDALGLELVQPEKLITERRELWNLYLKKTYLKTASLMAKGARAAVVLGGSRDGEVWKEVAYAYGRNLGIAFQLVDDILDYESGEATLGKPGGADLALGLATGPALYAWEEHPQLGALIARRFEQPGDVEAARDLVRRSSGVERTRELAQAHADKAREIVCLLPASDARSALEILSTRVVKRTY